MKSLKKSKIAIIDNGVNLELLDGKIEECICINEQNKVEKDIVKFCDTDFLHGTICALIVANYETDSTLISIRILEKNGKGGIEKIEPALNWCYLNGVKIVNLSLGTIDFREYDRLNYLINYYTYKGLILIAATSNQNYVTYPASFSNVIGVATSLNQIPALKAYIHLGVDRLANSNHLIRLYDQEYETPISNSYATPYVTAKAAQILREKEEVDLCFLKKYFNQSEKKGLDIFYEPDWIYKAYRRKENKSSATYYFQTIPGEYADVEKEIDTVIIDSMEELKDIGIEKKNIVYLGQEDIAPSITNGFVWSWQNRMNQIVNNTYKATSLELPLIILDVWNELDEYLILTTLKKLFADEGYHAYVIASKPEGVLYRLEYIPNMYTKPQMLRNFLEGQTHYKQNDLVLWSVLHEDKKHLYQLYPDYDMEVQVKQEKNIVQVAIWIEKEMVFQSNESSLTQKVIMEMFQNIKHFLAEDKSE